MPKTADKKLKKLIKIADGLFRNNGGTVGEVTRRLGISQKELLHALQSISMCGVPPYDPSSLIDAYIEDDRVFISHVWGLFDRPAHLSRDEALSLFLAGQAATASPQTSSELKSALSKIRDALRPEEASTVEQFSRQFDISPEAGNIMPILNILKKSCGHEKVKIEYYTAGRDELLKRTIHPYGLIYHVNLWYCVGHCELRGELRLFRVDRIKIASATTETFEIPPDFHLDDFRRNKMFHMIERPHEIRLRFVPEMAALAREKWPNRVKLQKDGSADVIFHVDHLENFTGTTLGYGKSVKVISPPEFRKLVGDAAKKTLSVYEKR